MINDGRAADTDSPTGVSSSPAKYRPGCAAGLSLLTPVLAAWFVVAQGADADGQINALSTAFGVFLAWLLLPVSLLLGWSRHRWLRFTPAVLVFLGLSAFTIWTVRPQAPDGLDRPETLSEGRRRLEDDVTSALRQAAPDHELRVAVDLSPSRCRDWFDRSRGAAYSVKTLKTRGWLTQAEFDELARIVSEPGRDVEGRDYGRPDLLEGQQTRRYVVRVVRYHFDMPPGDPNGGDWTFLELVTPCLREL